MLKDKVLFFAALVLFAANETVPPEGALASDQIYLSCVSPALSLPSTDRVAVLPSTDVPLVIFSGLATVGGVFAIVVVAFNELAFDVARFDTIWVEPNNPDAFSSWRPDSN